MNREEFIMARVKEHYEEAISLGHEVVAVFLQGSQNYDCDEYSEEYVSDVDTKCIILPSLDDIVRGKTPYSSTHVRQNEEHIDIKDIRVMFEMFKKQNSSYIEILFTNFKIVNPKYALLVNELLTINEDIARMHFNQALRCMAGTSVEKLKALEHPYPSAVDKIKKFGYDPKQLHHILRINDLMKKYIDREKPYSEILVPNHAPFLLKVKKGLLPLTEARRLAYETDQATKKLKDENMDLSEYINQKTLNELEEIKVKFIKQYLAEKLLEK